MQVQDTIRAVATIVKAADADPDNKPLLQALEITHQQLRDMQVCGVTLSSGNLSDRQRCIMLQALCKRLVPRKDNFARVESLVSPPLGMSAEDAAAAVHAAAPVLYACTASGSESSSPASVRWPPGNTQPRLVLNNSRLVALLASNPKLGRWYAAAMVLWVREFVDGTNDKAVGCRIAPQYVNGSCRSFVLWP